MVDMVMVKLKFNMLCLIRSNRNIKERWVLIIQGPIKLDALLMDLGALAFIGNGRGPMLLALVNQSFIAKIRPFRNKGGLDLTLDLSIINLKISFSSTARSIQFKASSMKSTKNSKKERILLSRTCLFIKCLKSKD